MKKIFSLFAAVLFAGSMFATEVTVDYAGAGYANNTSLDGVAVQSGVVTITFAKGTGTTVPAYYTTGTGARTYASNTITVDAGANTITEIAFDFSQNSKNYTVDAGTYSKDAKKWTGSANKVLFTTEAGSGHNRIKSITVTYEVGEEIAATAIELDQTALTLAEGRTATLKATLAPEGATTAVTWTSSDEKVATVAGGKVTAVAAGTATITAKAGDYSATCAVTVTEAPDPTNCAEAAEAALSVSGNNVEYKNGKVYTIEGYVTSIAYAYSATNKNMSFWMADTEDGGNVIEAYKCAIETEADAPVVGNKVKVTGKLTKFGTTPEFAAGCTCVIVTEPVDPDQPSVTATPEEFEITAEGSEDNTVTLEYANLGETFVVTAAADAEATWITNIALNDDKSELTFDVAANDGAARTATITVTATAGETVKTATITVSQAAYVAPVTGDYFAKVTATADITDGAYLIVYEAENVAFNGALETLDAVGDTIAVEIADGKIAATEKTLAAVFTLAAVEGGYFVKAASGQYIGVSSYSNGLKQAETAYVHNAPTITEDGNAVLSISNTSWAGDMILCFNADSGQKRFRYYKNGSQKAVQLYKLVKKQGPATAIDNTAVETKAVKTLRNGILVIEKAGVRYNVMGQIIR